MLPLLLPALSPVGHMGRVGRLMLICKAQSRCGKVCIWKKDQNKAASHFFFFEMESCSVARLGHSSTVAAHCNLCLLGSSNSSS